MSRIPTLTCCAFVLLSLFAHVSARAGELLGAGDCEEIVAGRYIVVLDEEPTKSTLEAAVEAERLTARYGGRVRHVYEHVLKGFSVEMSEREVRALAAEPMVQYIEPVCVGHVTATQGSAPWGLDRVDQRNLPINSQYKFGAAGRGVHAYVIDSGIRSSHPELAGRVGNGISITGVSINDCYGHGTHVAGILGGTTYGVAKGVILHPVAVTSTACNGSVAHDDLKAGVEWVTANHQSPAVANISVSLTIRTSMETAIKNSVAAGVTYVVGAGNIGLDACSFSPSRLGKPLSEGGQGVPGILTVAASDSTDHRSFFSSNNKFSNFGTCVDLFAPGSAVPAACPSDLTTFCNFGCTPLGGSISACDGTSTASPHVAGAAARYLELNPSGSLASPANVEAAIKNNASLNKLVGDLGAGSPNRLLYTGFLGGIATLGPTPGDDAFVAQEQPTRNFGSQGIVRIRSTATGLGRYGFYKFNVPNFGIITSATLHLRVESTVQQAALYRVNNMVWSENTINWSNWNSSNPTWTFIGNFGPFGAGTDQFFNVSSAVNGSGEITFGLASQSNTGQQDFHSSESGFIPELVITYAP